MATQRETHDSGEARLDAARAEHERLRRRLEAAIGTATELSIGVEVHAAARDVTARDAWLKWVDDEGYRGLHAGPFALRQELEGPLELIH